MLQALVVVVHHFRPKLNTKFIDLDSVQNKKAKQMLGFFVFNYRASIGTNSRFA